MGIELFLVQPFPVPTLESLLRKVAEEFRSYNSSADAGEQRNREVPRLYHIEVILSLQLNDRVLCSPRVFRFFIFHTHSLSLLWLQNRCHRTHFLSCDVIASMEEGKSVRERVSVSDGDSGEPWFLNDHASTTPNTFLGLRDFTQSGLLTATGNWSLNASRFCIHFCSEKMVTR